ncbi:unnamed protein product [Nezara viridula]|uniref:Uncharacterized protein n=1 Tax=Nezara viridula TaxID=85310 RepID=A0A9P0EC37_NEZVI|nr:unnamed protein product [Nezara viridula]
MFIKGTSSLHLPLLPPPSDSLLAMELSLIFVNRVDDEIVFFITSSILVVYRLANSSSNICSRHVQFPCEWPLDVGCWWDSIKRRKLLNPTGGNPRQPVQKSFLLPPKAFAKANWDIDSVVTEK